MLSAYPANTLSNSLVPQPPPIQHYTVIPSAGANGSISPNTSQVVNSGATIIFTATASAGYGVNQWRVDGNLAQTGGTTYQLTNVTANHTVNVTFGTTTLTPSVSTLALSVNCQPSSSCTTTQNAALTGNPRQITITNTGSGSASNVSVNASGLPLGTSISSNTCTGMLSAGGSCVITLTPGAVASSDISSAACTSGTQPVGGTVTTSADGGLSTQVNVYIIGYACQYQGGFVYSINDSTPVAGSIGGKVASLVDQADPYTTGPQLTSIIWSSNGAAGTDPLNVSNDIIPGIDDISNTGSGSPTYSAFSNFFTVTYPTNPVLPASSSFNACNGNADGACNTMNILAFYNTWMTNYNTSCDPNTGGSGCTAVPGATSLNNYAAGLCQGTINTYSDWYLPATCEMDAVNSTLNCSGVTQSMWGSLSFLIGDRFDPTPSVSCNFPSGPPIGSLCLAGVYWSSTVDSSAPQNIAWEEVFNVGSGGQSNTSKDFPLGVRCSRSF